MLSRLSVSNARLKRLHFRNEDRYVWGFCLMARGSVQYFFHEEKEVQERWIEKLKASVVLTDLREKFSIGHLIGKGNFAKVHTCKRKVDQQTYALKSIEKSLIRKNKRNSNSIISEIEVLR